MHLRGKGWKISMLRKAINPKSQDGKWTQNIYETSKPKDPRSMNLKYMKSKWTRLHEDMP
jgi:hypothetical protein